MPTLTKYIRPATEREVQVLSGGKLSWRDVEAIFGVDEDHYMMDGILAGWNRREELNTLAEAEKNAASVAEFTQKEESKNQVTYLHESDIDDGRTIIFAQGVTHSGWLVLSSSDIIDVDEHDNDVESPKTLRLYKDLGDAITGNWELKLWDVPAGTDAKEFIKSPTVEAWFTAGVDVPANRIVNQHEEETAAEEVATQGMNP
jgi:hypothetical protein